jgi:hypothetical protein
MSDDQIVYYANVGDAVSNTNAVSSNTPGDMVLANVNDTDGSFWVLAFAPGGSSYNNGDIFYGGQIITNTSLGLTYNVYPARAAITYFATLSNSTTNTSPLGYSVNSYSVGNVDNGSLQGNTKWKIETAYSYNGSSDAMATYTNGDVLNSPGYYHVYVLPPSILYFANSADASAGTNQLASDLTDYVVGTVDVGSIGTISNWLISPTLTSGTSSNSVTYTNGDTLNSDGVYYLYPVLTMVYFANSTDASAGTNQIAADFTDYIVGNVDTGSIGSTTIWLISPTLTTGTSNNSVPYANSDTLNSDGIYFLYPQSIEPQPKIIYFGNSVDATSGNNSIATNTTDFMVGNLDSGSLEGNNKWLISSALTTGTSNNTKVYTNGNSTLINDGVYYLFPAQNIIYFSSSGDALNGSLNNAIATNTTDYVVGTINNITAWNMTPTSTGSSYASGIVYTSGTTLNPDGVYFLYPNVPCFLEGTGVLCLVDNVETYVCVEDLVVGTLVKTIQSGYKKVHSIKKGLIQNPGHGERIVDSLYKCSPSKYPKLAADLYITGNHSILVDSMTTVQRTEITNTLGRVFVTDGKYRLPACIDDRAEPWKSEGTYTIWHFALEHENKGMNYGIYVNGFLTVETCSIRYLESKVNLTF